MDHDLTDISIYLYIKNMIGIYKITSPSGKVYIGQSIDVEFRLRIYKNMLCKKQPKIYRSLKKYGVKNHSFEIIEECSIELLDERETYWKKHHDSVNNGLNCNYYDETPMRGNKHSEEVKDIIRAKKIGQKYPEHHGLNISKKNKGVKKPDGFGNKLSKIKKGKPILNSRIPLLQFDIEGNLIKEWDSQLSAKNETGINNIFAVLNGKQKTSGGYIWKYKNLNRS